jgi:hypothetical protein
MKLRENKKMNNINFNDHKHDINYNTIGFVMSKFTERQLAPIKKEIDSILEKNFSGSKKVNNQLAGNIEHEYDLIQCKEHVQKLLEPLIYIHNQQCNYLSRKHILTKGLPLTLTELWVNFQKKHEFNPPHIHRGVMSFVIWYDIPYDIKDEKAAVNSKDSVINIPGHFQFLYIDTFGEIQQENIPVDKTYNGNIVLFPSSMVHAVYPFKTSDSYRITISGNFKFEI